MVMIIITADIKEVHIKIRAGFIKSIIKGTVFSRLFLDFSFFRIE